MTDTESPDGYVWQPLDVFKAARVAKDIDDGLEARAAFKSAINGTALPGEHSSTKIQPCQVGGELSKQERWAAAKGFNGFNTFLSMAEKSPDQLPPDFASLIPQIKLFTLDGLSSDFIQRGTTEYDAEIEEAVENFFLPFPVVAIQDDAGCVILFDFEEDPRGLRVPRGFVDISPVLIDVREGASMETLAMVNNHHEQAQKAGVPPSTACITFGIITDFKTVSKTPDIPEGGWSLNGKVVRVVVANKRELVWDWSEAMEHYLGDDGSDDGEKFSTAILNNVMTAVEEIMYINQPIHFILEEVNVKLHEKFQRKFGGKKKKKRYPRSNERPTYTVLPPKKIRQKMGLPPIEKETNGKKAPHWRRAHTRVLRSDRYRQKGKTIFVKACWIGPSEAKVGSKHYKVLLDK